MTQLESEKRLEQYWDGLITAIELSMLFIQDDLQRYECPRWRKRIIVFACWLLNKADFMHR